MAGLADEATVQMAEAQYLGRQAEWDSRLNVSFGHFPVLDEAKSAEFGHPVFSEAVFIRIITPGDNKNIIHRPARHTDFKRFRSQYEAFKQGQAEGTSGMPLKEWPQITRSEVEILAHFKVRSVEDLANLSDGAIGDIGYPVRHLVQRAQAYVAHAKEQAPAAQLAEAMRAKDAEMETLRRQIKEQADAIASLQKQSGRK